MRQMRALEDKLACIEQVILNAQGHVRAGDPRRIYSQYIRYALNEFSSMNFYCSKAAKQAVGEKIIRDHVVPHIIIMNKLLSLKEVTKDNILHIIKKYHVMCKITGDEDRRLTEAGLRSKMPDGWNEIEGDVFARYYSVGIEVIFDK